MYIEEMLKILYDTVRDGGKAVLVSVMASSGSTPRGEGARMAVFPDGRIIGTVGGGRVEYLCAQKAAEALSGKGGVSAFYDLSPSDIYDTGMICGGKVEVCFRLFAPDDAGLLKTILASAERKDSRLITAVGAENVWIGLYDEENGVRFVPGLDGKTAAEHIDDRHSFETGGLTVFMEPLREKGRVYIFRGGHVCRELAPLLKRLEFSVTVLEERDVPEDAFYDGTRPVKCDFHDIGKTVDITPDDYVVVMTSGHAADYEILEQALRKNPSYAGVIGSRSKAAHTRQRLLEAGVDRDAVEALHTPIGLAIMAATPAEIAVSVSAELIEHRAKNR